MAKKRVAVLFGGSSNEHDISLTSATNVIKQISTEKYEILMIGITKKGHWLCYPGPVDDIQSGNWEKNPDCVPAILSPDPLHQGFFILDDKSYNLRKVDVIFPVLHGKNGEDGTLQGLFELSHIPYVGCGVLSSAACMDKAMTHAILDHNSITTARYCVIDQRDIGNVEKRCQEIAETLKFPLFVKPAKSGSSIGISRAENLVELNAAIDMAFSYDGKVVIEEFIKGRELEVAVYGYDAPEASCVGEITADGTFYDFDAKYVKGTSGLTIPAELDEDISNRIRDIAVYAYKVLGCKGLSRVDFFLSDNGKIILNEINTLPGFTSISMYPKLMEYCGVNSKTLIDHLIEDAIRYSERSY